MYFFQQPKFRKTLMKGGIGFFSFSLLCISSLNHFVYADVVDLSSSIRLMAHQQQSVHYQQASHSFSRIIEGDSQPILIQYARPITVYFINPTQQLSDYWRRNQIAFKSRLSELGIAATIKVHDIKVNSPEIQKRKLLSRALATNPDFIILTLDTAPDVGFVETIMKDRNTHLMVQNITEPIQSWLHYQPLIYVGFDHAVGTKILADYFCRTFLSGSSYAVNNFYPSYISELRGKKFIEVVSEKTSFNMLSHVYTEATHGSARMHTRTLIDEFPDIDFIYASSTDIALGTISALQSMGRSDIKVNGWGGGSNELEALARNELAVTVMRMNDDNGVAMAEAVKLSLEDKEHAIPLVYSGRFKLLTSETDPEQVIKFQEYAFRYSGADVLTSKSDSTVNRTVEKNTVVKNDAAKEYGC